MAILWQILSVVLATGTLTCITGFAQENRTQNNERVPHGEVPELIHTRYGKFGNIPNTDFDKIDVKSFQRLAETEGIQFEMASKQHGDIQDWLIVKARENRENQVTGSNDGLDSLPIGNISQQCYNDLMRFYTDREWLQTYAARS